MSNRIWFPENPSGDVNLAQRRQLALGYSFLSDIEITPPVDILTEKYMRRYLNDPLEQPTVGPAIVTTEVTETAMTRYLRRYLVDPKS